MSDMKKKNKVRKAPYIDDGHTIYDMSGLTDQRKESDPENNVRLSRKEKWAATRAAFRVYLPGLVAILLGFGLTMLLIWVWLCK